MQSKIKFRNGYINRAEFFLLLSKIRVRCVVTVIEEKLLNVFIKSKNNRKKSHVNSKATDDFKNDKRFLIVSFVVVFKKKADH